MTATKLKPTETIGDNFPILKFQAKRIMKNCQYQVDTKNEWVQWATGDVKRTSLKSITQAQAQKIIMAQEGSLPLTPSKGGGTANENWGKFQVSNTQHKYIMSVLRTANIVVKNERWGEVADMEGWFARFLQSKRCPVTKPLLKMTTQEVSKVIVALEGVALWKNSI
jgi:hypothetical protein